MKNLEIDFYKFAPDHFERAYQDYVRDHYPEYAEFWNLFIGAYRNKVTGKKNDDRQLIGITSKPNSREREIFKIFAELNYSQFISLIFSLQYKNDIKINMAHSEDLLSILPRIQPSILSFYYNLDTSIELENTLYGFLYLFKFVDQKVDYNEVKSASIQKRSRKEFHLGSIYNKYKNVLGEISNFRNQNTHHIKSTYFYDQDTDKLLIAIPKGMIHKWSDFRENSEYREIVSVTNEHYDTVLSYIRESKINFIGHLNNVLSDKGLSFDIPEYQKI